MKSPMIHAPLTKLQCCPTSDGGAAVVIVSQEFLKKRPHLRSQAILIAGQSMATDAPVLFSGSAIDLIGYKMSEYAAREAFKQAGITPNDASVVELHDCFSANEMVVIDAMGLSPKGKAHELVRTGGITYGGKYTINPSGGLISKGYPLGELNLLSPLQKTLTNIQELLALLNALNWSGTFEVGQITAWLRTPNTASNKTLGLGVFLS
jgi:sterol carrier protein 2